MTRHDRFQQTGFGRVWAMEKPGAIEASSSISKSPEFKASSSIRAINVMSHVSETAAKTGENLPEFSSAKRLRESANTASDSLRYRLEQKGLEKHIKDLESKYYHQGSIDRTSLRKALYPNLTQTESDSNNAGLAIAMPFIPFEKRHEENTIIDPKLSLRINVGGDMKTVEIPRNLIQGKDFIGNLIKELDKKFEAWFGNPEKEAPKKDTATSETFFVDTPSDTPIATSNTTGIEGARNEGEATNSVQPKTASESNQTVQEDETTSKDQ